MKRIDTVIFDLDGTLLNTIDDIADSCNEMLTAGGYPTHVTAAYYQMVGNGVVALITRALPENSRTDTEITYRVAEYQKTYGRINGRKTAPYPGIKTMLAEFVKREIKLAILSNKPHEDTVQCMSDHFREIPFAAIRGADPSLPLKPDPSQVFTMLTEMSSSAQYTFFAGDSPVDVTTARNAGITPISVTWGYRSRLELLAYNNFLIDTPEQLIPTIDNLIKTNN